MNILGISRLHNGSVCLLQDGKITYHIEEERLNHAKYEGTPFLGILKSREFIDTIDYVACCGFEPMKIPVEPSNFGDFSHSLYSLIVSRLFLKSKFYLEDYSDRHHLTHAAGAFYNSGFDNALSLVFDGDGSPFEVWEDGKGHMKTEKFSAFECSYPNNFKEIKKEYFHQNEITKDNELSLGNYFATTALQLGMKGGMRDAGKVMGLASYGKPSDIDVTNLFHFDPYADLRLKMREQNDLYDETKDMKNFQKSADLSYAIQDHTQKKMLKEIKECVENTGIKNVCLSGGYVLNCVANYYVRKNLPDDINLYVEPISHDGGTAIGGAKLLWYDKTQSKEKFEQKSIYYGFDYNTAKVLEAKQTTAKDVASKIMNGNIVALYQGKSEQGPRALGNRSILFNPTYPDGKDIVNKVKGREWYRPFAGTILHEHAHEWFDMAGLNESPFMMYAVDVLPNKKHLIPAITHVDGTCRIQTLKREQNEKYYDLINEFYKLTGVPILFNTSFNLAGKVMVETIQDALETVNKSDINYLYLPENEQLYFTKQFYKYYQGEILCQFNL